MTKRKDGRWCKVLTLNGKRIYFYSTEKTEKKAAADIQRQILTYTEKEEKGKTFAEVADEWEEQHYPQIEYNTEKQYIPACRQAVEYFDGMYIKQITPNDINRFITYICQFGYAQKTVKTRLLVTNLIFKYAVINRYVDSNPCVYISLPKNLRKTVRTMPTEDDLDVVKNSVNKTFGLFAYFILYTGLRRGEALALQYGDIDLKNRQIHVTKSVYHKNNKPCIKTPKTEAGQRNVLLLDNLIEFIPKKACKSDYVFCNADGDMLTETQFQRQWELYLRDTGLNITPHQLRHAYASMLFDAGIDVKDAQDLMGHTTIQVTRDIYTHISQTRKNDTRCRLNQFLQTNNSLSSSCQNA